MSEISRRRLEQITVAVAAARLAIADGDLEFLLRCAPASELSAAEIASRLRSAQVGRTELPPFPAPDVNTSPLDALGDRWLTRFPLWSDGQPIDVVVTMTVEFPGDSRPMFGIVDIARDPAFPRLDVESIRKLADENDQVVAKGLRRHLARMNARRSAQPPDDLPDDLATAVRLVQDMLVIGDFSGLERLHEGRGLTAETMRTTLVAYRDKELKPYQTLLGVDPGPWAVPPQGLPPDLDWMDDGNDQDAGDGYQATFIMWTSLMETDLRVILELHREENGGLRPVITDIRW